MSTALRTGEFEVYVSKADFKFNCSHFIAFKGFRERIHGHNYRVSIRVTSNYGGLGDDGYLIDFGDIKKAARSLCKAMNEYFIVPTKSDFVQTVIDDTQVCMTCEDGSYFSMPKRDCLLLPIVHSSAEEMAYYLWCALIRKLGISVLHDRFITSLEVTVAEAPQQHAAYRNAIPPSLEHLDAMEAVIMNFKPSPCLDTEENKN